MHPTPPVTENIDARVRYFAGIARFHRFALAWKRDGEILAASPALMRLVGRELVGTHLSDWLPELGHALPQAVVGESHRVGSTPLRAADQVLSVDVMVLAHSNDATPGHCHMAILRVLDGADDLDFPARPSADFLATMLDNAPEGVVALDRSGFVIYANAALLELTGLRYDQLLQQPVGALFPQQGVPPVLENWSNEGEPECEIDWKTPSGSTVGLHVTSRHLVLPSKERAGHVVFVRDVTDRRRIQRQLEEKNAELENYVNTVSHDLRSPLASLLGFSRLLRQDYQQIMDEMGHHFLDRIDQAGHTMETLIEDLLTISKIGELGIQRTWIDPNKVLEQLRAELKPLLEEKNIALRLPIQPPMVLCDRTHLYQLVSNLVGNAIRHGAGGEATEIRIEVREEAREHVLSVNDNGPGIDPVHHERIFHVFQTLGRGERETSTGMGLAIVRKIATLHGGRAWVESQPRQGARFHVSLPHS